MLHKKNKKTDAPVAGVPSTANNEGNMPFTARFARVLSAVLLVVSLLLLFGTAVSAWLASNRNVDSDGAPISAGGSGITNPALICHPVTSLSEAGGVITYTYDGTKEDYVLQEYDEYSIQSGTKKQMLILCVRFTVTNESVDRVALSLGYGQPWKSAATIQAEAAALGGNADTALTNSLSNCVEFARVTPVTGTGTAEATASTTDAGVFTFVTPTLTNGAATGATKTAQGTRLALGEYAVTPGENTIWLVMRYNEKVVRYLCSLSERRTVYSNDLDFRIQEVSQ